MKVCLLGKYPPIQGGVSTTTYWMARGLAERGHDVHVVTNAPEVDDAYRSERDARDDAWYEPRFADGGGRVVVHATAAGDRRALSYIPRANPFVSKLAGLAAEVVEAHDCDVLLAYYFEPYAVAGALAAHWTGRPLVVKHAGSDLDRLMRVPELAATYKRILRSADAVVTQPGLMARFCGIGVRRERLRADPRFPVPADVFSPHGDVMAIARDGVPAIGIYGKIGIAKGTYDLVAALGRLAADGLDFDLLAMIGAGQGAWLEPALRDAGLLDRTRVIELVAPWRVPSFIRACTAVCFLERSFPVAIHGPLVPREVLACGTCLVLSGEIAAKQAFGDRLVSGENLMIAGDPTAHRELAAVLLSVIADPVRAAEIGQRGHALSERIEPATTYGAAWEALLTSSLDAGAEAPVVAPAGADLLAPAVAALIARHWPDLVEELAQLPVAHDPFGAATACCDRAADRLADLPDDERREILDAALRYQRARLGAMSDAARPARAQATPADLRNARALSDAAVLALVPVTRGADVRIDSFDFDVSVLFTGEDDRALADADPLAAVPRQRRRVLFARSPNLVARELLVDDATAALVECCDGMRTTAGVVRAMTDWFDVGPEQDSDTVTAAILEALARLHDLDVIVFTLTRPGDVATPDPHGGAGFVAEGVRSA